MKPSLHITVDKREISARSGQERFSQIRQPADFLYPQDIICNTVLKKEKADLVEKLTTK